MLEKVNNIYKKVVEMINKFISKDNYTKVKLVMVMFFSIILATACEYTIFRRYYPEFISKNRIMLVSLIYMFIGIHFVFKLNVMYEWIHKNRYKIACAFLLFVMIFKYSGSSIVNFNGLIQSHNDNSRFHTLLGKARMIRTDEWATSTTYILSQSQTSNPFSYFSNALRGTSTDMVTVANGPVFDILMLAKPFQIMFLILGNDYGLSFYWYARLTAMLLGSYELCLILTKKNKKVSFVGMIVITFSAAVQWWYCMDTLIWGQIVIVLLDKFMKSNKKRTKYLCALGILIAGLSYIFVFYPAWQISFGYLFLAMVIYILIDNIKYGDYKINKHDIIVLIVTILALVLILGRWYLTSNGTLAAEMNTDYPGERQEVGGGAYNLYSYFYDIFFTSEDFLNPCEYSSMLSFFPIPLFLGLIYAIRNRKNLHFYIPMLVVGAFLTVWCIWGFPAILANLTKMSMTTASRATIPLGTVCIYILIHMMGTYEKGEKLLNKKLAYVLTVLFTVWIVYKAKTTIGYAADFKYLDRYKLLLGGEIFLSAIYGILNLNNEKIRNYLMYGLIVIALMSGLRVNPIIRTTDIFYEKPVSKKFMEIKEQDPDAIWVVNDGGWYLNDYALASGIRVLNSTNVYPNLEFYEKLLGDKAEEKRSIYNRYCHVNFAITDDESDVELLYPDNIAVKMNYKELSNFDIKYILSTSDLTNEEYGSTFEKIYDEDGIYIFKIVMEGIEK